jgi:predicted aldo/keto reductase-like oxidoreductase
MDRREFIKSAGLGAAALGVAACAPGAAEKTVSASTFDGNQELKGTMLQNYPGIGTLGYGCMRWPMKKGEDGKNHIDQEEVNRLVDFALAHGVNYFDTSPVYLGGDSERASAEALNRHTSESWKIATKLSIFGPSSFDDCVRMYRRSLEIFKTD